MIWTGDLNISREEIDSAPAEERIRKKEMDSIEYMSAPGRRLLNQLLVGGKVLGEKDEGREKQIMWDICRAFHPGRKGMYTCWDTKLNTRPGNYGSRIDYVLCSADMKDWWMDSNIQEGLMGSDHCPVYAVMKEKVVIDGKEIHTLDIMNPPGMFVDGIRKQEWSTKNLLPMSGRLIPEFDRRRNIRDMFSRKPPMPVTRTITETSDLDSESGLNIEGGNASSHTLVPMRSTGSDTLTGDVPAHVSMSMGSITSEPLTRDMPARERVPMNNSETSDALTMVSINKSINSTSPTKSAPTKRSSKSDNSAPAAKRSKAGSQSNAGVEVGKGQQSLKGFFKAKVTTSDGANDADASVVETYSESQDTISTDTEGTPSTAPIEKELSTDIEAQEAASFASKQTWGKLFARPIAPKCDHNEPCKTMLTKKPGVNCGRSFWMCNRPLGPNGKQERGTQWRCPTFIWASDWDGHSGAPA